MKLLTQEEATAVDDKFFKVLDYTLDQLMELAGLSVANVVYREFSPKTHPKVLVVCGPGNNGGDGLVCARHLIYFGYTPEVVYPKQSKTPFLQSLVKQLGVHNIPVYSTLEESHLGDCDLIVDAIFGYSFKPPVRGSFSGIIAKLNDSKKPILCVDVPSGWDVEKGDVDGTGIKNPAVVVSLSAPKLCMQFFSGVHYLGGRFVPPKMAEEMGLDLPAFPGCDPVVKLN